MTEAWIIDGVRSPRGKGRPDGALHHLHPQFLLSQLLRELQERTEFEIRDLDDVIMGCANAKGVHDMNVARLSVLDAGWPIEIPGITFNRACGSGQSAINFASAAIAAGQFDLAIAGGVEMMSRYDPTSLTFEAGNPRILERYEMVPQGIAGDLIATIEGFTREECDRFGLQSQRRAREAIAEDRFGRSMIPIHDVDGSLVLDHEQHPRPGTTAEGLAALRPAFADLGTTVMPGYAETFETIARRTYPQVETIDYVHHGGNSSGVVDGASALLLASPDYARAHGLTPRARIMVGCTAGSDPVLMLTGPAPSARRGLKKAGMTVADIDLFECNEAFAAVVLKFIRDIGADPEKVNVNGGGIALGHPIGATGGVLTLTLLDELERRSAGTGLVTMCTGGGMGTCTIIERL